MSGYNEKPTAPPGDQVYQQQGAGYPPPAYSEPQPPYPPSQPAYPPPQPAAYAPPPPQAAYPPPQYNNNSNQPLLQNQPAGGTTIVFNERVARSDQFIIVSIIVVIWSFFCGLAYLVCSVPALILSIMAKDDERLGDGESARTKQRLSIILNIIAIVTSVIFNATFAILIFTGAI